MEALQLICKPPLVLSHPMLYLFFLYISSLVCCFEELNMYDILPFSCKRIV